MGWDIDAYRYAKDEDYIFETSCMYAYSPVFKEVFGKDIIDFKGRVTKKKIYEFETGIQIMKENKEKYSKDGRQFAGYMSNISFDDLISDFEKILELMKNKECMYLNIY